MPQFHARYAPRSAATGTPHRRRPPVRPLVRAMAVAGVVLHLGAAMPPAAAQALPSGMNVVHGQATAVVNGGQLTVTNSANAVLNWQAFSVGAGNQVRFDQPAATSRVLNRVVGNDPSQIFGSISSNGQVWLLNPHGVIFGRDARVDVASLVASTLNLPTADWIAGRGPLSMSSLGAPGAAPLVNQGELRAASGGRIWLIGGEGGVRNEGLIAAPDGQVVLAAGRSVDLVDERLPNVAVRIAAPGAEVRNLGRVTASGGRIDLLAAVVNQSGIVQADRIGAGAAGEVHIEATEALQLAEGSVTSANGSSGGRVRLDAGPAGTLMAAGSVAAAGSAGRGGEVQMLGRQVGLVDAALVDASGAGGGGEVVVGGGQQGRDGNLRNAEAVYFGPAATVRADATVQGDGGRIILWSDRATRAYGNLSARGGAAGGDGGFIETSGGWLDARPASVRTDAPAGRAGQWLLDPYDIEILSGSGDAGFGTGPSFTSSASATQLGIDTIVAALATSNVTITTGSGGSGAGDILMDDQFFSVNLSVPRSLTLNATQDLNILFSTIESSGAPFTLNLNGGRYVNLSSSDIFSYGGPLQVNMTAGASVNLATTNIYTASGALGVVLRATGSYSGAINTDLASIGSIGVSNLDLYSTNGPMNLRLEAATDIGVYNSYVDSYGGPLGPAPMSVTMIAGRDIGLDNAYIGYISEPPLTLDLDAGRDIRSTETEIWGVGAPSSATLVAGRSIHFDASTTYFNFSGDSGVSFESPAFNVNGSGLDVDIEGPIRLFTDSFVTASGSSTYLWSSATGTAILMAGLGGANVATFTNAGFLDVCPCTAGARWLFYLDDGATGTSGLSYDFVQVGTSYPAAPVTEATGNGLLYSTPAVLAVTNTGPITKVYDGTRAVSTTDVSLTVTGLRPGDFIADEGAFSNLTVGDYVDPNVGSGILIGVNGFVSPTIQTNAYGGPVPVYGYSAASDVRGDITPRPLTVSGLVAANKVYDGNVNATLSGGILNNLVPGQTLGLSVLSASFDTPNVGAAKPVTGTVALADGSGLASNYELSGSSFVSRADITPRILTLGGVGVADKVYDATRAATFVGGSLDNLVDGESLGLTLSGGLFDTADAGNGKPVTGTAQLTNGANAASNYQLAGGGAIDTTGNILRRPLTVSGVVAADKVYDGTRAADLSGGTLGNLAAGQTLVLTLGSGLFDTANVGVDKPVSGTALLADGSGRASNYLVPDGAVTASADITRRPLVLSGVVAADKVYDGTRNATFSGFKFDNLVAGEALGVAVPDGAFDTAHAGIGKPVTGNAVLVDGSGLASNYQITGGAAIATTATIDRRPLTLAGVQAADKVYDGSRDATLTGGTLANLVSGETLGVTIAGGLFDTANAGIGKPVAAVATLTDGSGRASNYVLAGGGQAAATATIERRPVTVSGIVAADKFYDGTRTATLSGGTLANLVGSENLGLNLAGLFDTKDVGVGKPITGTVALVDGSGLAANYTLNGVTTVDATASITQRLLTLSGVLAADKVYDGTRDTLLSGGSLLNLVVGESLALSYGPGLFDTADAGSNKPVTGSAAIGNGSAPASNYRLADAGTVTTTASVERRPVTLSGVVAADKLYDGSRTAALSGGRLDGLVAGQSLGLALSGLFDTADAGVDKPVAGTALLADGSGRAANYLLSTPGLPLAATIDPAPLLYVADPVLSLQGRQLPPLTGTVTGFVTGETLATATTGSLGFTTTAAPASLPGPYAIDGFGLSARNYTLAQAPGNAVAMTIAAPPPREGSNELASVFANLSPLPQPTVAPGASPANERTMDALQGLRRVGQGGGSFGSIDVDRYSRDALSVLLESRSSYKRSIFAGGMKRLEDDPTLADLPACVSTDELDTGKCLVSEELLAQADAEGATATGALAAAPPPMSPTAAAPAPAPVPAPAPAPTIAAAPQLPSPPATAIPAPAPVAASPAAAAAALSAIVVRPKVVAMAKAPPIPSQLPVRAAAVPQIQRKIAVLVGLDNYVDERIPLLENAGRDVEAVAQVLQSQLGYQTVIVRDASREAIVGVLNRLALTARPNDSVVVYYAGHGTVVDATGQGYWIPASADADRPQTWISNSDIGKLAGIIRASQVVLISDSCFSGTLVSDRRLSLAGSVSDPTLLLQRRATLVMSSGGNEPVADGARNGHSPFAASLMQTLSQLQSWRPGNAVFEQVRQDVTRRLPQTPHYGAARLGRHADGADYVFEQRQLAQ